MKKKLPIMISCLILAVLVTAAIPRMPLVAAQGAVLRIDSDVTEFGPDDAVGQTFTVNCTVADVDLLYGVDIQIGWTTEYIEYVSHTKMIPVETYPDGILHTPSFPIKDLVDETASMPGSEPGAMYWLSEACLAPAATFNGTGNAFEMTFRVKNHPIGVDSHIIVEIIYSVLADKLAQPIPHTTVDLDILLHGRTQPAGPEIEISSVNYRGSVPYTFDVDVSILGLDAYWDLAGFDIQLTYSAEIMQATSIEIDPDGWWTSFWPGPPAPLIVKNEIDNTVGKVWVAVLGIPDENGTHTEPFGDAILFTVSFSADASGPLEKVVDLFSLAAYPHPERAESPFNSSEVSAPIPYSTTEGFANIIGVTDHLIEGHTVTTESNSSVSSIAFTQWKPILIFNVTGANGYSGFCNITVPTNFMWNTTSPGWLVLLDGQMITPTITSDASNTYIYFTFQHSKHGVAIVTDQVIPEFSAILSILLILSMLGLVLNKKISRRKY